MNKIEGVSRSGIMGDKIERQRGRLKGSKNFDTILRMKREKLKGNKIIKCPRCNRIIIINKNLEVLNER